MSALVERIIAARDRLRPLRLLTDDYFRGAIGFAVDTLADAGNALETREGMIRELLEISISHYGNPTDESFGVGLLHARARALCSETQS